MAAPRDSERDIDFTDNDISVSELEVSLDQEPSRAPSSDIPELPSLAGIKETATPAQTIQNTMNIQGGAVKMRRLKWFHPSRMTPVVSSESAPPLPLALILLTLSNLSQPVCHYHLVIQLPPPLTFLRPSNPSPHLLTLSWPSSRGMATSKP